jgi:hypothetical protein
MMFSGLQCSVVHFNTVQCEGLLSVVCWGSEGADVAEQAWDCHPVGI